MDRAEVWPLPTAAVDTPQVWLRWRSRLPLIALFGLMAYIAIIAATQVFLTSPGYDDSYFGSVARNFAAGQGYGTIYGETDDLVLSPGITTGPSVIVPAAISFKLFGSHYWVGALVASIISLALLTTICWLLASRLKVPTAILCLTVAALLVFTNDRTNDGAVFNFLYFWSHLMGDIPVALLVVIAAVLVCLARSDWRIHMMAGACLALAFYAKFSAVWAVPGFALFYLWDYCESRRLQSLPAYIAGGLSVVALVEGGKLLYFGSSSEYANNFSAVVDFYLNQPEPAGVTDDSTIAHLMEQLSLTVAIVPLILWAAIAIGAAALMRFRGDSADAIGTGKLKLALILIVAGLVHSYWWWAISDAGWIRYLIPAIMYFTIGLFVLASVVPSRLVRYSGLAVFALLLLPQVTEVAQMTPEMRREARLTALLHTSDYLNTIQSQDEDVSFWGCGWWANRDLHLAGHVHFYDCTDSLSVARHLEMGERLLLVRSEYWNWENSPVLAALAQDCDQRAWFREGPFSVCDATPWLSRSPTRS